MDSAAGRTGSTDEPSAKALADALYEKLCGDRPPIFPLRDGEEELLRACDAFRFGERCGLAGWSMGDGPLVFLSHGWGGRGAQMAKLARALAEAGFRAVFFDAGGHGASETMRMGFDRFMSDAAALQDFAGAPYGWVGHSAGALALMSARRTHGISASRYAFIAPPFFPYVPIERMRKMGAPEAALERVKPKIARQFDCEWHELELGLAWAPETGKQLLVAYDDNDEVAHRDDADAVLKAWPGTKSVRTAGLGHNRILHSATVIDAVVRHLAGS
jgi:pimeloyl-ACP methyl ester carboxylesterase